MSTDATTDNTVTYPTNLLTARDQIAALLLQVTLNPKPSYSVHGHSYSWQQYQEMLTQQLEQLGKLIAQANPFEIVS